MKTIDDLRATTWLDRLCPKAREALLALGEHCTVSAGSELVVEGSLGSEVFVVLSGVSRVVVRGAVVARLGRGSFVGEMSLLDGLPRSATVVAESPMELLVFDPAGYQGLLAVPGAVHEQCRQLAARLRGAQAAETK